MKKRLASTLLALALCLSLLPTAALADGGVIKLTQDTYTKYLEKTHGNDYLKSGKYILGEDITLDDLLRIGCGTQHNPDPVSNVTLDLNGHVLTVKEEQKELPVLQVYYGSTLTIQDSGASVSHKFSVDSTGRWQLDKNGTHEISGGIITSTRSRTMLILDSSSKCTMTGGNIVGGTYSSYGGGVYVGTHAEFTMNGGSIRGCTVTDTTHGYGGGVFVVGTFTMTGGTISDCTSAKNGGGVYVCDTGTFTMGGNASIENCTAKDGGGVYIEKGETYAGTMYADGGQVAGTVTNNGTITSNGATSTTFTGDITGDGSFVVKFNLNGGEPSAEMGNVLYDDQTVKSGEKVTQPAAPTKSGYRFSGWYCNGSAWNFEEGVTAPMILTAQWSRKSSGGSPSYAVTAAETNHGTVALSTQSAKRGSTVTITVKPDSGYVLETLAVVDGNGNEQKLTDLGEGRYTFSMPSGKVEVKATFQEDNSVLNVFYDVPNDAYYFEAVKWAVGKGITNGVSENLFGPDRDCTRAQIVTFLWRAAGSPVVNDEMDLTDVPADAYYAEAVRWALSEGITTGTGAGTFSPDAACTRAQAVTFLARALGGTTEGAANFQDVPAGSYYAEAVAWAVETGVTNGISEILFGPDQACTRGQIVTFLFRAYEGK